MAPLPMARPTLPFTAAPSDGRMAWRLLLPLLLAVAAYARVLDGEFVFDDLTAVVGDPAVRDLGGALRGFLPALLAGRRPVTVLTFALDHAWGGLSPRPFHVTNLAIHLLVTCLAFLLARAALRLAGTARPTGLAVAVAGLFALHPLQSQAVSYVVQRAEALAAGFYLATLLLLLVAERRGLTGRGVAAWLGALATFVLGLGAKATLVTLPAAWVLLAWALPTEAARRALARWPRRLLLMAPFLAVEGAFVWRTLTRIQGSTDAGFSVPGMPASAYLLTQARVVLTYLRLLAWPAGQSADWAFPTSRSLAEPGVITAGLALATLLAATVALWRWARRRPPGDADAAAGRAAAFGVAWFFVALAASSLVPREDVLVEHRVYLAALGIFLAAAVAAERAISRYWLAGVERRRAALLITAAAWGVLAMALHRRNAVWQSAAALWGDAVAQAPHKPRARFGLGNALLARGDHEGAAAQYREALASLRPDAPVAEAPLQQNLGTALLRAGRPAEAVAPLRRAVALMPWSADAAVGLAVAALGAGELDEAEREARRTLGLAPGNALAGRVLELVAEERLRRVPQGPEGAAPSPPGR